MFSELKCVLPIKASFCGFGGSVYGWKTCCYTEAVECRKSSALFRFVVYISELVSACLLWIFPLHSCYILLALLFFFQSDAYVTSRRRPFPFPLIKKCRLVSVLLSERQFGSWNSSSSCKVQQLDSPPSTTLVSVTLPNNYVTRYLRYIFSVPAASS